MPANRKANESRRLTVAGLIAVTAATLLMMAWAIFPSAAFASTQQTTWNQVNGAGFVPCVGGQTLWILTGFGNEAAFVTNVSLNVNGDSGAMAPQGNNFRRLVNGPNTTAANTNAVATWTWDDSKGDPPTPILTLSHCEGGTTTTTTTTVPTTTTTVPTTTTTVPTTTTTVPTTTTTVPTTTTTVPTTTTTVPTTTTTVPTTTTTVPGGGGGGGGGTTTVPVTTTTTPTVGPTTVQPSTTTKSPNVAPTTVSPRGTAFTGVENVVPIGAVALMLMTSGTGLLWAGSRRRRDQNQDEE